MFSFILSVFIIAIFGIFPAVEFEIPVSTCKRNSDDYSACFIRFIENLWPQVTLAGVPELDFPPFDPLLIKDGKIVVNTEIIRGETIFFNISIIGLSKTRFFDVRTHFLDDVYRLELDGQIPKIFLEAIVKINGTLSVFRVINEGYFNATLGDMRGTFDIIGHVINDTWIVEHFRVAPSIEKFKLHFDSTIEGNKGFSDLVITFVNEYWPVIYRAALPFITNAGDPLLSDIVNQILSKLSFSKIFL